MKKETYEERKKLQMSQLTENGGEIFNPEPVALIVTPKGKTFEQRIKDAVRNEISQKMMEEGFETFEEANDFNVFDEFDETMNKTVYEIMDPDFQDTGNLPLPETEIDPYTQTEEPVSTEKPVHSEGDPQNPPPNADPLPDDVGKEGDEGR